MKKTNKAVSGIAALTIAASALSGCGNAGGGKTKITLMTIKDYYTTALNEIAKDYNKKNPDTQIEIQVIGDNGTYSQNFITKITMDKKTAPDIIHTNLISGNSEGDMITKNWLLPLDDFLEEENPYNNGKKVKDAFTDPVFLTQAVSSVGKVGYLPFDCVSVGCYYNKTIFEANNIEVPATYEDFSRALEKLRQAGYKNPLGATAYVDWFGASLADWGFRKMETQFLTLPGDALYNEETMKANTEIVYDKDDPNFDVGAVFNDEKIVAYINGHGIENDVTKKIWETQKSLWKYCTDGWVTPDDGQTYNQFFAQKIPVFVSGSWEVGRIVKDQQKLAEDKKFEWGVFPFPVFETPDQNFEGQPRGLRVAGHKLGIVNKDDEEREKKAADFLKYMYSPEVASKIYKITLDKGELVQGPSLIEGVTFEDEVNEYMKGFECSGTMVNAMGKLAGAWSDTDTAIYNDYRLKYVSDEIDYDTFIAQISSLTRQYVENRKKTLGYDLDPATLDTANE